MTPIDSAVNAIVAEFFRQAPEHGGTFFFDADNPAAATIDGTFDLSGIARAVLNAIREPSAGMVKAAIYSTLDVWPDERDAERETRTEFIAAIDSAITGESP